MSEERRWTIQSLLLEAATRLKERGFASARLESELLLAHILSTTRINLYINFDKPLSTEDTRSFGLLLRRRFKNEPVAYLLGRKEFMGFDFLVDPRVLIPRPETELLVEACLEACGLNHPERCRGTTAGLRILDVGTGSGCIAISLALKLPANAQVEAWDVKEEALTVARENAERLKVAPEKLTFRLRDMTDPLSWHELEAFDFIISNPPYIAHSDHVHAEVSLYEPHGALFAKDQGTEFYAALAKNAKAALKKDGQLILEIGASQGSLLMDLFHQHGWSSKLEKDLAGLDRMLICFLRND